MFNSFNFLLYEIHVRDAFKNWEVLFLCACILCMFAIPLGNGSGWREGLSKHNSYNETFFFSYKFKARQAAIIFFEALLKSCLSANCISRLLTNTRYLCIEETVADPRGSLWQGSRCEVFGKTDLSGWCQVSRYKPFPWLTFLLRYLLFCDDDTFVAFDILSGFLSCVCNLEV